MIALHQRILVLSGAAALALLALVIPSKDETDVFAVAVGVWPGMETLVMSRERGMLPSDRIRLVEMTWDSAGMRALGNKVVDAAVLSLDEVVRLRESGHDVRVVLVFDQSLSADALVARTVADLRGKRIGVDLRAAGMFVLAAALEKHGLKSDDVTLVPMSPSDMTEALSNGDVEAVVCVEPWLGQARRAGAVTLFESSDAVIPVTRMLVVRADAVESHAREIRSVVRAHFGLVDELRSEGDPPGRDAVLRREKSSKAAFLQSLQGIRLLGVADNRRLLSGDAQIINMAREVEALMRRSEQLSGTADYRNWLDASFLPEP